MPRPLPLRYLRERTYHGGDHLPMPWPAGFFELEIHRRRIFCEMLVIASLTKVEKLQDGPEFLGLDRRF